MIKLSTKYLENVVSNDEINAYQELVNATDSILRNKTGQGNDFLGWIDLPTEYDKDEFARIKSAANKIKSNSEVLLVIGIGGSYLGAKAAIDFLNNHFYNNMSSEDRDAPEIYFVGNNISSSYMNDLKDLIKDKNFSINIISKSGTTTEPAIAFRFFKDLLVNKYGTKEANERIYATTDKSKGALKDQVDSNGWESFVVPDDVGGRFSVLTAVGLLPIACSGADIDELMTGAREAQNNYSNSKLEENDAYKYAVIRNALFKKGYVIEMLIGYEPSLMYFNEWWKQLYGESQGKNNTGIFPASAVFSTDLHSMGQYIQEGRRNLFETVLHFNEVKSDIEIKKEEIDGDGLNYLAGKNVSFVNDKAFEATAIAHMTGGVPNVVLEVENMTAKSLGHLIYFFEISCALDGYLLAINPFNQPGVEEYKKNMFALLGKSGFEDLRKKLEQ